jgi:restriction system protein
MALWMVRVGRNGEYEQRFLNDKRLYITWNKLSSDLGKMSEREEAAELLRSDHPENSVGHIRNSTAQIWAFAHFMKLGDWVAVPSKQNRTIHFAEITGEYQFNAKAEERWRHWRTIKWLATDVPRDRFDQDILFSLGAVQAICQIKRNDAEKRVRAMAENGWKGSKTQSVSVQAEDEDADDLSGKGDVDLEQLAYDQIATLISQKFVGDGLERLVDAILRAKGYFTYKSPIGADKGVDILAGSGELGFGEPRICVQVKSETSPIGRPVLDQLIGTMQNVQADQGLLVSLGGFKDTVRREEAAQFFRVRLWDQQDIIEELLAGYGELDPDIKAELPLKQMWAIARPDSE